MCRLPRFWPLSVFLLTLSLTRGRFDGSSDAPGRGWRPGVRAHGGLPVMRFLRVLAALFLIPLVVFANPTHAAAATWTPVTFTPRTGKFVQDVSCWAPFTASAGATVVWGEGVCKGGMDISPWEPQYGEPGSLFWFTFRAVDATGTVAESSTNPAPLSSHPDDSTGEVTGKIPTGNALAPDGTVTEVCLSLAYGSDDVTSPNTDCRPLSLEVETPEECPTGDVVRPQFGQIIEGTDRRDVPVSFTVQNPREGAYGIGRWQYYTVHEGGPNGGTTPTIMWGAGPLTPTAGAAMENTYNVQVGYQLPYEQWPIIGVGMVNVDHAAYVTNWQNYETNGFAAPGNGKAVGLTDASACTFYWGAKVIDWPTSDKDEPVGDLPTGEGADPTTAPPPPTETDEPINDEPSFWERMWQALKSLASAVMKIPGAILDGLEGLFVPDKGFFDQKVESLKDAWADTPPLVVIDGVGSLGDALTMPDTGGGCNGPELAFTTDTTGPVSVYPFSSCREEVGRVAGLIKTVLTIGVYVGAFLASVRIIGASLGLDLSFGKGGDE